VSSSFVSIRLWKRAPRTAIPTAMPICRKVLLMPVAMPARSRGTTPMAASASVGLTRPAPAPASRKPTSSAVHSESTSSPRIASSPAPTIASPAPRKTRSGIRSASFAASGAKKNAASVIGSSRTPVSSGE
jgi:hypothetical protein